MSVSELLASADPMAEEIAVMVHRTVHGCAPDKAKMKAARLFMKASLLTIQDLEGTEAAEQAAASMMRRFAEAQRRIPGSQRRRK